MNVTDDEAETDAILASLLAQLDNLESQQHESITFVHDQFQKQRQAVDALRKSVRDAESVIHQKRFSRQRAKIKRLKELKAAGTPRRHSAAPGVPSRFLLEALKENKSPPARKAVTSGKTEKTSGENKVAAAATPLLASGSTPTGMGVSRRRSVRFATDIEEIPLVGESPVSDHDDVDIVMMGGDDDGHPASASPLAPVAPPMETPESRRAGKKPATTETVVDTQGVEAAEKATKVEKRSRPAKMRPTRGGGSRGRGGTMRGTISGRPRGGGAIRSISPRPSSHELEPAVAPTPRSTAPTRGYGTARRAQPFKRGGATSRSSSSARGSDASEGTSAPMPATKTSSMLDLPSRFIAVNTPGPSTLLDDWDLEGTPLSALPAGAGVARTGSSPLKPLPPPRSKGKAVESPRRNSKRLQTQDLPPRPFLFSSKDLRAIFGGGNPGSIIANVTPEGQRNAVVEYASYICLSLDAHFDPPGTMCDNAAILDVDGQEDPLDSQTVYPVWRKVGKAWLYCGDYTQGKREMVSVGAWKNSNEGVKKYWAKKVQETEWGREFLVRKGLRGHGEIKNNSVADVLGYFEMVGFLLLPVDTIEGEAGAVQNKPRLLIVVESYFSLHPRVRYHRSIANVQGRMTIEKAFAFLPPPSTSKLSTAPPTTAWLPKPKRSTPPASYCAPWAILGRITSPSSREHLFWPRATQSHPRSSKLRPHSARGNAVALKQALKRKRKRRK